MTVPRTLGYRAQQEEKERQETKRQEEPTLPVLDLAANDAGLTDDQIALLRILKEGELQVDDLIEAAAIPTRRVLSALTLLEIEGYVSQSSGKRFTLQAELKE